MTEREKMRIACDLQQLQIEIAQRFSTFLSEQVVRHDLTEEEIERFKASINYVMDERFGFIIKRLPKGDAQ